MMARSVVYLVDGFNVYHSLRELGQITGQQVKWLDLRQLLERHTSRLRDIFGERVEIARIRYFSALATHLTATNPDVVTRHQAYIRALESAGVEPVLARFKRKDVTCPHCRKTFARHEEKETDVAMALGLVEAFSAGADAAVLVSGDSDLAPGLRTARAMYPGRKLGVAFPFNRRSTELQQAVDFSFHLQQREIQRSQFPHTIPLPDGTSIVRPAKW